MNRASTLLAIMLATASPAHAQRPAFSLTPNGYLHARGADILVFNNHYNGSFNDEKISGVEIIHHDVRTATNGDVRLSPTPEQWDPTPEYASRTIDSTTGRISATLSYPAYGFRYRVEAQPAGDAVILRVVLDAPLPSALVGRAGLNLEFLPSAYYGRGYLADGRAGMLPRRESGIVVRGLGPLGAGAIGGPTSDPAFEAAPMATGSTLVLAPDDAERRVTIAAQGGATVALHDGRNKAQNGWFVARTLLPANKTGTVVEWRLTPSRIPNWTRPAIIAHSQVGYHPDAVKVAIVERDPSDAPSVPMRLLRVGADGRETAVLSATPSPWGRWLRYDYARFDFSRVKEPGLYVLRYGSARTEPFRIATDVYADVWQPSLDTYLAVQMDHVTVNDRYRVWHGASHLDDAVQAPVSYTHFDLYGQGPTTDSPFKPGEHIPGLDVGGWFDAGDFDLRTQSQYAVVQSLVEARETFGVDWDQTTVRAAERYVDLRRPDGVPDIVQQVEHGVRFLLAQYRSVGHAIPGIVEPTLAQYTHLGDAVDKTDNKPGTADDRIAFTSRNTGLDYGSAAALAASSRVLGNYDAALADECLRVATRVWDEEHARTAPVVFRVGNTTGGRPEDEELKAIVELLVTTKGDAKYADRLRAVWPTLTGPRFDFAAGLVLRALPFMDATFRASVETEVRASKARMDAVAKQNPFGVPITGGGWAGSGAVLGFAMRAYQLHRAFPAIVGPEYAQRGVDYLLGTHPASSTSMISGVGARSRTIAYGSNRADYTFIPGGIVPGVLLVQPDFPEMKEDWPFLWYEGEYVIPEAAQWIYLGNAMSQLYR